MDSNKAIFKRPIYQRTLGKRKNYYNLLEVSKNILMCGRNDWNYNINNICQYQTNTKLESFYDRYPCLLSNGDVIEIHPSVSTTASDLCHDYSFWKNPERCSRHSYNVTKAVDCNRDTIICNLKQTVNLSSNSKHFSCSSSMEYFPNSEWDCNCTLQHELIMIIFP